MHGVRSGLWVMCGVLLAAGALRAAPAPELPELWVSGAPMKLAALKGKVVVLWFFHPESVKGRARWPELYAVAKKYEDRPLVWIAVNSGSTPQMIRTYAQSVKLPWPAVVDSDRSFERACNIINAPQRSSPGIMRIIDADGQMHAGDQTDIANVIEKYLGGAKWTFDPSGVPASLKAAWRQAEFGDLASALPQLQRAMTSGDPASKAAATKMLETVGVTIEQRFAAATAAEGSGKYEAYKLYRGVATEFKGHPRGAEAAAAMKRLEADEGVKAEVKAAAAFDAAAVQYRNNDKTRQRQGKAGLEELLTKSSQTEGGKAAAKMLNTSPGPVRVGG